jgi:hypothetical protein
MANVGLLPSFLRSVTLGIAAAGCAALAGLEDPLPAEQTEQPVNPPPSRSDPDPPTPTKTECSPAIKPPVTDGAFHVAPLSGKEPAIDGAFDDWACIDRTELGRGVWTTAKFPETSNARIAFRWTPQALYFHASIETTTPGFEKVEGFSNDSLNLFIGPPNPGIKFRTTDHQFSFDHLGKVSHYISGLRQPLPPTIQPIMKATTSDTRLLFELEARIEPALIGAQTFEKGQHYTLGLQLHDRLVDTGSVEWRTWYRGALCGCSTTDPACCNANTGNKNLIACDLRCTGELVLD